MKEKKKKIFCLAGAAVFAICLCCGIGYWYYYTRGHVKDVILDYGKPQLHTIEEVKEAGDLVIEDFKSCGGYNGCEMKRIYYDEEYSEGLSRELGEETISFRVYYRTGRFPPLNESALTDTSCTWDIGRKSAEDAWEITNAGEG